MQRLMIATVLVTASAIAYAAPVKPADDETPKAAFEKIVEASEKKDWGTLYERMDNEGRKIFTGVMELAKQDPVKGPALKDKSGKELFVAVMKDARQGGKDFPKGAIEKIDEKDNKATIYVKTKEGKTEEVPMIKEEGTWRLHVSKDMPKNK